MTTPLHIYGAEYEYDEDCDCPRCTDWRESHCPKCGEVYVSKMRTPADTVCFECRYPEDR